MNVWIAHPEEAFAGEAFDTTIQSTFKDSMNTILAPHALAIDTVSIFHATAEQTTQFSTVNVDDDAQQSQACEAMLADATDKLAIHVIYVQSISTSMPGGGGVAGFSPSPGSILGEQPANGCVFVNQSAYTVEEGLTEDEVNQSMAANILHESGHFMSLQQPTEAAGDDFDQLADTPECDAATYDGRENNEFGQSIPGAVDGELSDYECGVDGGARNFMFYSGIAPYLPFEMSMDQARVLRRHPLFTRVGMAAASL